MSNVVQRLNMLLTDDLLKEIDNWRRSQPVLVSRSEAIRKLLWIGLSARMEEDQ